MPYEFRQEEADKWNKDTWTKRKFNAEKGIYENVELPVSELPKKYAKNIINSIRNKRPDIYKENYVAGSKLWLALIARVGEGEDPLNLEKTSDKPARAVQEQSSANPPETINHNQDFDIIRTMIDEEVKGIKAGTISTDETVEFLQILSIKINLLK